MKNFLKQMNLQPAIDRTSHAQDSIHDGDGRDAMQGSAGDMMGSVSGPFTGGEEEGKDMS